MTTLGPLTATEIRLLTRDWGAMVFAFVLPPMMMLVLAGVFAGDTDGFGGANGSDYYVAAYLGVPLAALALVGLPVSIASYRELGVLRRFEAFGVPTWRVVTAQTVVTAGLVVLGGALVLATAAPGYGIPAVERPAEVVGAAVLGTVTLLTLGVALGLAVPTARSAQAIGLLIFLPMWLLGGGGPPKGVMTDAMQSISDVLPLWHVTAGIREPWLGTGDIGPHLVGMVIWLLIGVVAVAVLLRRRTHMS